MDNNNNNNKTQQELLINIIVSLTFIGILGIASIWSINTLFPDINIEYNIKTLLAMSFIVSLIMSRVPYETKNNKE